MRAKLSSIGHAVVATNTRGDIIHMDAVAEQLTGWKLAEAQGKALTEVFNIVNAQTGKPVGKVLASGKIVGLASHTMLIAKDEEEYQIAVSAAPIQDADGAITGVVLVFRDVTEEYRVREDLQESEERFKQIAEAIDDVFVISDVKTWSVLYVSPAYEQIWGRPVQALYEDAEQWSEAIHPDDRQRVDEAWAQMAAQGSPFEQQYRVIRPDGSMRWVQDRGYGVHDETGHVYRTAGIAQDITDRKQADKALQESEARFTQIAEAIDDVFVISDLKSWSVLYASPAYEKIWGRPVQALYEDAEQWSEAIHPDDRERVDEAWAQMVAQGSPYAQQYRVIRPDGSMRWVQARAYPVRDESGQAYRAAEIVQDITKRLQTEEALLKSEARFKQIAEAIDDVFTISDLKSRAILYASPAYEQIWGRPVRALYEDVEQWGEGIHPDDRQRVEKAWTQMLAQGGRYEQQYRVIHPDGSTRWVQARGYRIRDESGQVYRVVGIAQVITARKLAEDALKEERWRLESILKGSNVGTWEWNVQTGEIIYNDRWAEIIGYTLDEVSPVSTESFLRFVHPDDLKESNVQLEKHFKKEQDYYELECRIKHRDGHWVWVLDRGRVFSWTENGKPLMMFGTHQDITDRKRAELMLRESEKRFQRLSKKDVLTGLLNRRGWEECISGEESRAQRYSHRSCVIVVDLDGLKETNDLYGHKAGDDLIIRTARCLHGTVREVDSVARIGGDEFAILGVECDKKIAAALLNRIKDALSAEGISASGGMAMRKSASGLEGAMAEADRLMYEMKAERRTGAIESGGSNG